MIVDTSALIAVLRREPEADRFVDRLLATSEVRISAGTFLEIRIVAERDDGGAELDELMEAVGIEVVPVDARHVELAFDGFRRFGKGRHPAGLNFGDLFAYGLARALDEPLLSKGDDFNRTDIKAA
ncbi:MAG: type II toxin-antitoxin system VapC family toxin [Proteobacteria bacterium]|nr:type II toxin-antitoxin system VapC family toxin [Pseudomonadota bacterium]